MALCFWGGIRASMAYLDDGEELEDTMNGSEIRFDSKRLIFTARQMKQATDHLAEGLPENLWPWLKMIDPKDWAMTSRQFYYRRHKFEERAKMKIPHNSPRKSFGTYMSTLLGDNKRVAQMMSDRTESIFLKHYRADDKSIEEAEAYVAILPRSKRS